MWREGDRVALRSNRQWKGTVEVATRGVVAVVGDGGWKGTLDAGELVPAEDKSWPPAGMETK